MILLFSSCGEEKISLPWSEIELPTIHPITDIQFTSLDTGYISTGTDWEGGEILETYDGGTTWTVTFENEYRLSSIDIDRAGNVHTAGYVGRYAKKNNEGWQQPELYTYEPFTDVASWDGTQTLLIGGENTINGYIVKIDQSNNILSKDTFEFDLESAAFVNESEVVTCGYGIMMKSNDAGTSWNLLDVTGIFLKDIQFPTTSVGYSCGYGGSILKSTDGGNNWSFVRDGDKILVSDKQFNALHFEDENHGFVVGINGLCWRTTNGGSDWQVVKNLPKYDYTEVHVRSDKAMLVSREGMLVLVEYE